MGVPVELIPDRRHDARVAMPGVHHSDPAREIDEAVAVDVGKDGAFGVDDGDRGDRGHAARHGLGPAGQERAALGAGNLGPEVNEAGHEVLGSEHWATRL